MKSIGERYFSNCRALSTLTLPASTKEIGKDAIEDCSSLIQVELRGDLTKVGKGNYGLGKESGTYTRTLKEAEDNLKFMKQ